MDKATNNACEPEIIEVHIPTVEAVLSVADEVLAILGSAVGVINRDIYTPEQAKAAADIADATVLFGMDAIKAIVQANEAFDAGYDEGHEDDYDEAATDYVVDNEEETCNNCNWPGVETSFFQCPNEDCGHIGDTIMENSENGDKICTQCGWVVVRLYDNDHDGDPSTETPDPTALYCATCTKRFNSDNVEDNKCPDCDGELTEEEADPQSDGSE